jgi:hypothetical protein
VATTEIGLRLRDAARAVARAAELLQQLPNEPEDDGPPPTFDFMLEQLTALKDTLKQLEEELNERRAAQS